MKLVSPINLLGKSKSLIQQEKEKRQEDLKPLYDKPKEKQTVLFRKFSKREKAKQKKVVAKVAALSVGLVEEIKKRKGKFANVQKNILNRLK